MKWNDWNKKPRNLPYSDYLMMHDIHTYIHTRSKLLNLAKKTEETRTLGISYSFRGASDEFCGVIGITVNDSQTVPFRRLQKATSASFWRRGGDAPLNGNGERNAEKRVAPRHPVAVWLNFTRVRSEWRGWHQRGETRGSDGDGGLADKNYPFKVSRSAIKVQLSFSTGRSVDSSRAFSRTDNYNW